MIHQKGFVYIRDNAWYKMENVYKMGIASYAKDREGTYITGEVERGEYICVIEIQLCQMKILDKCLKTYFKPYHIYRGGGTEFYDRRIVDLIEGYLQKTNVEYKVLSKEEIELMNRCERVRNIPNVNNVKKIFNRLNLQNIIQKIKNKRIKTPRPDQIEIIDRNVAHFQVFSKGINAIICGVGKTLISCWTAKALNSESIVIGVPNKLLLNQWENVIAELFPDTKCLIVSGGVSKDDIITFLNKRCIVITTYASAHKVRKATKLVGFVFDMKILDECHHLTSSNISISDETKSYIHMLRIKAVKQLALTATLKHVETHDNTLTVISNKDISYFGEVIAERKLLWAINESIVCNYVVQTIITNDDDRFSQFGVSTISDKRLLLSAYAALKSISSGHSHHVLIYANNTSNSERIIHFVKLLEKEHFCMEGLYSSAYNSHMNPSCREEIVCRFETAKYGIVSCVYCLGEGWDFPMLDAVVFAENMTSNIRIVQSALRASRKNTKEPNKITKIILPVLNSDDMDWTAEDLKQVQEIIYQLGQEDETIEFKIRVSRMSLDIQVSEKTEPLTDDGEFCEYDEELTTRLRLRTMTRHAIGYERTRKLIAPKNIKNKEAYYLACDTDIRLPKDPENTFKGQMTSWVEYLSIARNYYELDECKTKTAEYLLACPELIIFKTDISKICNALCEKDPMFPPNGMWVEYYHTKNIQEIIKLQSTKKK